mgnify:CR=1 FL=1
MAFLPFKTFEGLSSAIADDVEQTQKAIDAASVSLSQVGVNFSGTVSTPRAAKVTLTNRNSLIDGRTFVNQERHHLLKRRLNRRKNIAKATINVKKRQQHIKAGPLGPTDHLQTSLDLLMEFGVSITGMDGRPLWQTEQEDETKELNLIAGSDLFDPEHKLIQANRPLTQIPVNLKNFSLNSLGHRDLNAIEFYASEYGYLYNVLEPGILSLYSVSDTQFNQANVSRGHGAKVSANRVVSTLSMYTKIKKAPNRLQAKLGPVRVSLGPMATTKLGGSY